MFVEPDPTYKRWSLSALECMERGGHINREACNGCFYQQFFFESPYDCKMYLAVEQLIERNVELPKYDISDFIGKYGRPIGGEYRQFI